MEELIQIVLANYPTLKRWKNDFRSEEYLLASDLSNKLFGMPLNRVKGCECVNDLYIYLHNKHKINNIMAKENARFVLKPNKLITAHGCAIISEHSRESDYIRLLQLYPAHIVSFERYPENWKEIVAGGIVDEETTEEVEELEVIYTGDVDYSAQFKVEEATETTRESELSEMKNAELKALISEMGLELPEDTRKAALVAFIIENESK